MHPTNKPTIRQDPHQATQHASGFGKLSRDRVTFCASRITFFILLCLTALLPTRPAHAQSGRTYTTADGLPSNNIQARGSMALKRQD